MLYFKHKNTQAMWTKEQIEYAKNLVNGSKHAYRSNEWKSFHLSIINDGDYSYEEWLESIERC